MSGCLVTDTKCLCTSSAFGAAFSSCVISSCDASDQLLTYDYDVYNCGLVGVTVPPYSVATPSATASSPANYASSATTASPQNAASPTVNNKSNNIGPIVGGVVGGIVGLTAIIGGAFFVYKRGRDDGVHAARLSQTIPPNDPRAHSQGSLLDLEKEGLPPSVTSERDTRNAREQGESVETGLYNVGYGNASSGYVQAHHEGDIVETIPPVNVDLPSGRLRYPDGDNWQ